MISDDDIRNALDRIARTPDGELLYLYLQIEQMGMPATPESSALLEHNGHRKFAAKLMGLMAKGIEESGGRTEPGTAGRPAIGRPIVLVRREPVAVSAGRGAARRVTADQPVPGTDAKSE
jgi:hypothetical protein